MTVLAGAVLALACSGSLHAQTPNLVLDGFTSGSQWFNWDGYSTQVYAAGIDDGLSGDPGSEYITDTFSWGSIPMALADCYDGDTPWYFPSPIDFSQYEAVQFDILWDTTSGLTIDQFNTGTNWQSSLFTTSEPQNYMQAGGYVTGIDLLVDCTLGNLGNSQDLGSQNIPENAGLGWQTMTYEIPPNIADVITASGGVIFSKSYSLNDNSANISAAATANFWIDNLVLIGNTHPIPNPTLGSPIKPIQGLNIFNATESNTFYDRNEVVATTTSGLSWVGHPGASYSFNMASFPTAGTNTLYGPEAYMFLVPNSATEDNAPDQNEATCMIMCIQATTNGSQTFLSYKVNSPNGEPGVAIITNQSAKLLGSYSLTFTGDDAGYLTGPDGGVTNFTLNGADGETWFAETGSAPYNFLFYIGGQANTNWGIDQAVVYSSAGITGVASPVSETFIGESTLANFSTAPTSDPSAVVLVPASAAYWIAWSAPATGFTLENTASLTSPITWNSAFANGVIGLFGTNMQLVLNSDLQTPDRNNYFQLVKHSYSDLVVALPGQTFTSGVGVTGTPAPINGPIWIDTAVCYAVDSGNDFVTTVNGNEIQLSCATDTAPSDDFVAGASGNNTEEAAMVNGVASFTGNADFYWGGDGLTAPATETVTITDETTAFTATSSPVTLR
jgi:hypothetical protein